MDIHNISLRYVLLCLFFALIVYMSRLIPYASLSLLLGAICLRIVIGCVLLNAIGVSGERDMSTYKNGHVMEGVMVLIVILVQAVVLRILVQMFIHVNPSPTPYHIRLLESAIALQFLLLLLSACEEELLFRGVIFHVLRRIDMRALPYICISATLFSLSHAHLGILSALHAFLAGIWLSIYYFRHRRLLFNVALHFLYNGIVHALQTYL